MCDIFDEIPTIRDGQIVTDGCEVTFEAEASESKKAQKKNEIAKKAEGDMHRYGESAGDADKRGKIHGNDNELSEKNELLRAEHKEDSEKELKSDADSDVSMDIAEHTDCKTENLTDGFEECVSAEPSDEEIAEVLKSDPTDNDAEVISADEAEVYRDYPDTSADVDIEPMYRRLVDFYLTCGNKRKAAELAGFKASSDQALRVMASRAFKREDVKLYCELKSKELAKKADLTSEAYMAELVSIATFDIKDVVETEKIPSLTNDEIYVVRFKNIEDIPEFARKAVKAIEIAKDGTPKMVFYDKLQALKLLGEIKGYLSGDSADDDDEHGVAIVPSVVNPEDLQNDNQ